MKMTKEEFKLMLINEAKKYDIEISNKQAEKYYLYKELLLEWNDKINLTSITDDEGIIIKHFIDCLLCINYIKENDKIIDVGTGAGFPGIVVAIYFEGKVKMTLLDSLNKRIMFLDEVINKLNIKNIETVHGRAEDMAHNVKYRQQYDIAVARAVAPLNILLEYISGYVKKGGNCICMKASSVEKEINNAEKTIDILKLDLITNERKNIKYKDEEITRTILSFKKLESISDKYPRNYSKIKKNPL